MTIKNRATKQQSPASPETSPPDVETIGTVKGTTHVKQAVVTREVMGPRQVFST